MQAAQVQSLVSELDSTCCVVAKKKSDVSSTWLSGDTCLCSLEGLGRKASCPKSPCWRHHCREWGGCSLRCWQVREAFKMTLIQLPVKNWLIGKDPDDRKDRRQEEKGATEDEMVGWHHRLNGHEFEPTPGEWTTGKSGVLQWVGLQSRTQLSDWTTRVKKKRKKDRNIQNITI